MCCNKSHTRLEESVGCTLDSDSFFHFKPAQPANLCFSLHCCCVPICVQKKKKALNAEWSVSESIEEQSSIQKPIRVNEK